MGALAAVDVLVLAVMAVSVVVGAARGFVREALALAIWVAAFVVASLFAEAVQGAFAEVVAAGQVRYALAFGALFLLVLIAGALVSRTLGMLVDATGLTGLDRVLGVAFGAARAIALLVVAAALLEGVFANTRWWQASRFLPPLLEAREATLAFFGAVFDSIMRATGN